MRPMKHRQDLFPYCKMLPLRIRPRHVAEQSTLLTGGPLKEEWQVTDRGHTLRDRDQCPEGMVVDQRRYTLWACFLEMLWKVHG